MEQNNEPRIFRVHDRVILLTNKSFDDSFNAGTRARIVAVERHRSGPNCDAMNDALPNPPTEADYFTTFYRISKAVRVPEYGTGISARERIQHYSLSRDGSLQANNGFFRGGEPAFLRSHYHQGALPQLSIARGPGDTSRDALTLPIGTRVKLVSSATTKNGMKIISRTSNLDQAYYEFQYTPVTRHKTVHQELQYLVLGSELMLNTTD